MRSIVAAAILAASSAVVTSAPKPALAWDAVWCKTPAAAPYAAWCAYRYPNPTTPSSPVTATGGNATSSATGGNATAIQKQQQQQSQTQSLNNRLNQSLVGSGNSYNSIRIGAQLPMVNAPECGGVNVGGSVGFDGYASGAISAATHIGRRPDSCVYHEPIPQAAPIVYVQPAVVPASVPVERTKLVVYREPGKPACPLDATRDQDLALLHAHRAELRTTHPSEALLEAGERLCIPRVAMYRLDG